MTAVNVRQDPRNQRPTDRPVLYWSERAGSWWPGVGRRCPACTGALYAVPPMAETRHGLTPGRIACLMCEREWADVLDERRPVLTAVDLAPEEAPRRGRPPKPAPARGRCQLCGNETVSERRLRCAACVAAGAVLGGTNTSRLLALLADGRSHSRQDARAALGGLTSSSLQKAVHRLRARGVPIVAEGECYRLAVMP